MPACIALFYSCALRVVITHVVDFVGSEGMITGISVGFTELSFVPRSSRIASRGLSVRSTHSAFTTASSTLPLPVGGPASEPGADDVRPLVRSKTREVDTQGTVYCRCFNLPASVAVSIRRPRPASWMLVQ